MYLLDTNVMSEVVRRLPDPVVETRFQSETRPLFTSVICLEEIRFGAMSGPPGNRLWERFSRDVLPTVTVLPLDVAIGRLAGDLRAEWKRNGTPVGYRDGLIAATAKALDYILVTRNVRHFDHVQGLTVENWFAAAGSGAR